MRRVKRKGPFGSLLICAFLTAAIFPSAADAQSTNVGFGPLQFFSNGGSVSATVSVSPNTSGDARLHLTNIFGDLNDPAEIVTVTVDGTPVGTFGAFGGPIHCGNRPSQTFTIPQNVLSQAATDGTLTITFSAPGAVDLCDPAQPNLRLSGILTYNNIRPQIITTTKSVIRNFLRGRANQITALEPDLSAGLTGSIGIGSGGATAEGNGDNYQAGFATSLQQLMSNNKKKKMKGSSDQMNLGRKTSSDTEPQTRSTFDIWVRGTLAHVDDETRESDVSLLLLGADYRMNSNMLFGVLAQVDWVDESDNVFQTRVEGRGFAVGPYIVSRVSKNLTFDSRVAWGRSDNDINALGQATDNFETQRWLARARLTGDYNYSAWRFSPHVGVIYFKEDQESYFDSLGIPIPGQSITLGRVTFGPKIIYTKTLADGTVLTPQLALEGIWDFDEIDSVDVISGLATGSEDIRARTEARLAATFTNGLTVVGEAFYDGIGADDLDAYGGSLTVRAPLR